jgi:hypothetical protein
MVPAILARVMGLTIHYTLSGGERLKLTGVQRVVAALRQQAVAQGFEHVGRLIRVGLDYPLTYWKPPGALRAADLVNASEGWVFHATPGAGSESAMAGLCRFAGREGWWLESFCKTQYAARHGWEHFLRCHHAVIQLLEQARRLGLGVAVDDESGLWETGSFAVLRRNLAEYEEGIAAFGGALKDAAASVGQTVENPIFNHPQFEPLEAQSLAKHGGKVVRAVEVVKQLIR